MYYVSRRRCPVCQSPLVVKTGKGRERRYCTDACKAKAYRERKAVRAWRDWLNTRT